MPYMGYEAREGEQSNTCPLQKSGFLIIFAENSPAENNRPPKNQPQSITALPVHLSNKQTDPINAFTEKELETQWAVPNLFRKNSAFSDQNWQKKIWQKTSQHSAQLKGAPSINAKTFAFPCFL